MSAGGATGGIAVETLELRLPSGAALASAADLRFNPGDHVLVTGPSGSGKSTLFRAIAGIWPFASGRLTLPQGARVMVLPQRPYFPVGTLEAAVSYPALPGRFDRDTLRGILRAVGLPAFTEKLDEPGHWNRMLSLGEQQRLALARAILEQPDYLFLDEATASLDEPSETALYRLLTAKLPGTTIVSIGHRSTLKPLHDRLVNFEPAAQGHRVRESALATAEG